MTKEQLKERFKQFAIKIAFFALKFPYNIVNKNYSDKLNRSAPGAAANYRAGLRGKSSADFLNKLKNVEEELDESLFFLELVETINPSFRTQLQNCLKKALNYWLLLYPPLTR